MEALWKLVRSCLVGCDLIGPHRGLSKDALDEPQLIYLKGGIAETLEIAQSPHLLPDWMRDESLSLTPYIDFRGRFCRLLVKLVMSKSIRASLVYV